MQLRQLLATTLCAFAALAIAQGPVVSIAEGNGAARSRENQLAEFSFRVLQTPNRPAEGRFRLATKTPEGRTAVVEFLRVERFAVEGNKARFVGPAVLVVRDGPRSVQRVRGVAVVEVVDIGPRSRERDLIHVVFKTPEQVGTEDSTFAYGGAVFRGNIVVRTRTGDRP